MKIELPDWTKKYFTKFFPFLIIFITSLSSPADSDLGWHLKYGEYFFKNHKILVSNIFSTDMVGYNWINSSWGTDLLSYFFYHNFGFAGLSILGAVIITMIFYFIFKAAKLDFWNMGFMIPILLYIMNPLFVVSFRGQLLTLLFICIFYFIVSKFREGKKFSLLLLIPMFTLWSNLHGEFILGLVLFLLFVIGSVIEHKSSKINYYAPGVFILSIFATLINPFGMGIYTESVRHFGNPYQRFIIEWQPFDLFSGLWWTFIAWGILIFISVIIMIKKKVFQQNLFVIIPLLIIYFMTFFARRYSWPMYLISVMAIKYLFDCFKPKDSKLFFIIPSAIIFIFYIYFLNLNNPLPAIKKMSWDYYCTNFLMCSSRSAKFLIDNHLTDKLYTFYNWGGWLIWNFPEIKPSIDGRMHLWQDKSGYSAFWYYYQFEQGWKSIDKSKYNTVYIPPTKPIFRAMQILASEGKWRKLYSDEFAYIYARND